MSLASDEFLNSFDLDLVNGSSQWYQEHDYPDDDQSEQDTLYETDPAAPSLATSSHNHCGGTARPSRLKCSNEEIGDKDTDHDAYQTHSSLLSPATQLPCVDP